ncbi:kinase-like domain protein [Fusarium tjaetaba]|uniref:Kinase-like domain protein n=1 Tax=Fusarium tjaetaba TaxID=1567544 RepID=A0A8H5VM35_9HYPO|nr:kinase-like domain protein [Fusarium tjaetaba]KAF5629987.1 kinase-like domain protein [Fusarium tjaetaba]
MNGPAEGSPRYHVGDVLELHILQSNADLLPQSETISVRISQLITSTMSIVVRVNFDTGCAILKLYDRRFGAQFRECHGENIPYCDKAKAAYHAFLQRGAMEPFLQELDIERSTPGVIPRTASDIRDEPDGVAWFEAALWRNADKAFKTETEAYTRMQDLKGCSLSDLITAPWAPTTEEEWFSIVQSAVDSTHEINKRGIVLDDSAPHNVVADRITHPVFIVDCSERFFRDTMFDRWAKKAEGWNAEAEYCEVVTANDNPGAIGLPTVRRIRKKFGWDLDIAYPESDDLLLESKCQTPDQ